MFSRCLYSVFPMIFMIFCVACGDPVDESSEAPAGLHVAEGYSVELVAGPDLLDYPMFATLDESGRLFVFESIGNVYQKSQEAIDNPRFRIKLLVDKDGDGRYDQSTIFADSLSFPQGGVFHDGSLIVTSAPDLLKLTDTDGDGIADQRQTLLSGWVLNVNANSLIGPFKGPDGWLYMTSAIEGFEVTTQEGEHLVGETARMWRVRPDGSDLEWVAAGGMNNPVELTFTPAAEVIGTQTFYVLPQRGLRDAILFWVKGGIYGRANSNITRDGLALTGDLMPVVSTYSRAAPAGIGAYRGTALGNDFKGNLFSAQFNTHSVLRHKLTRDGANFKTEDETFFSAESGDFHPTDVLEDADGSLLVVETGGWFILGCPLSQVSKPQLKGGIYRIRKNGADKVEDPYGNDLDWTTVPEAELAELLSDPRPFVADRAVEQLTERGHAGVAPLMDQLTNSTSVDGRTRAVFALYRIGSSPALAGMRKGLKDADLQVQVAAARSAGLAGDRESVSALLELVRSGQPAVQRQAATALGQIGARESIPVLLETAASATDRFVRHALIYAMITLNDPAAVSSGLQSDAGGTREAALIALDQMAGSPLRLAQLTPFLNESDSTLHQTALWVASHHPEWAGELTGFLKSKLQAGNWTGSDEDLLANILTAYCGQLQMQQFMAESLRGGSHTTKLFVMEQMGNCPEKDFPEVWINALKSELAANSDPTVRLEIIQLIRLRQLQQLQTDLQSVAGNENLPAVLRVEAIGGILDADSSLSASQFQYLTDELIAGGEAPLLQRITAVLEQARLSGEQYQILAERVLPALDPFMLPRLLPAMEGASDLPVGQALARALMDTPSLDNFTEDQVNNLFARYPEQLQPTIDELLGKLQQVRSERLKRLEAVAATLEKGNIENGRQLYFGKAICWTCHTMGTEGGRLGPDLTAIQHDRSVHDILEAILYPSAGLVRDFETFQVSTAGGQFLGTIQEETPEAIVLGTGPQTSVRLSRNEITGIERMEISMMPQGLDQLMTEQEFADLMAFLLGEDLVY